MSQYTPMIQQYLHIKSEVPDAILFFRLGDFYEMFFEDANLAARELEITLTGREGGMEERIPMCGVPYHAAENYVTRLIEKGYKVAICEQVEEPGASKGVVRREIVRIITPGTVMESKSLGEKANNFIVCVSEQEGQYAISACDMSTGQFYTAALEQSLPLLADEVFSFSPAELIGDEHLLAPLQEQLAQWNRRVMVSAWGGHHTRIPETVRFMDESGNQLTYAMPKSALDCATLLYNYVIETQKRSILHITNIRYYDIQQYMTLDPFTRRNLEVAETVRDRSKKGSLVWLLDKTVTSIGARQLRRWIDKPLTNRSLIEGRLEAVNALYHQLIEREDLRSHLQEIYDLERLIGRIAFGNANARDLNALAVSLRHVPALVSSCQQSSSQTLNKLVEHIDPCQDVRSWIDEAIVDQPPVSVRDGGMIRQGYDNYLDQLHLARTSGKQWIAELEQQEREATGIRSLKVGFNKVFGYYIEVTKAQIAALPEDRYVRKQTLANAERFITPELKEKEALILEAEEKTVGLEYELFMQLRNKLTEHLERLQQLAECIAQIDALQSMATVSAEQRFVRPEVTNGYDLIIENGRHPVVEAMMQEGKQSGKFIHNDTYLEHDDTRMLLITGPNMAGKSTYMRQVALICFMAQIGCFVPAQKAQVPVIDRIFTRIGAADDLIGGQSTFMVEMKDIQVMTEKATSRSLVIIDELGRGTSTEEGMAIAQAVIEFLHHQTGCKTLVSTHFHELAYLEQSLSYLKNFRMAVKESGEQVTFLRKLVRGAASTSYGIYCAKIAGLPDSIIIRANHLMHNKPEPVQLEIFVNEQADQLQEKDSIQSELLEQIKSVDLMNMTPLQVMSLIQDIQKKMIDNELI